MAAEEASEAADELAQAAEQVNALLASARRRIWVHTRSGLLMALPAVDLAGAMSRVARCARYADVRLLVDDDLALKNQHPRLARTVTHLTSAIAVRCLNPEQESPASLLLVVDRTAWLYLVQHKGRVGLKAEQRDPAGNRSAGERFLEDWAIASESLELRRLTL